MKISPVADCDFGQDPEAERRRQGEEADVRRQVRRHPGALFSQRVRPPSLHAQLQRPRQVIDLLEDLEP